MNQGRQNNRYGYTYGSAAYQAAPEYRRRDQRNSRPHLVHENRRKAGSSMTLGMLAIMSLALIPIGVTLAWYISLQAQVSAGVKQISKLESRYNTLKQENDEAYNRAYANDLEEIKRIAIQEYGMKYAEEGQIITYSDQGGHDYVHQSAEIPAVGK